MTPQQLLAFIQTRSGTIKTKLAGVDGLEKVGVEPLSRLVDRGYDCGLMRISSSTAELEEVKGHCDVRRPFWIL